MTNTLVITATAGDSTQQNAAAAVTSAVNLLSYIPALGQRRAQKQLA